MNSYKKKSSLEQYFAENIYVMRLNTLINRFARWLDGSGRDSNIVISSRVRLARNLQNFPFPDKAKHNILRQVVNVIKEKYTKVDNLKDSLYIDVNEISEIDRQFLMERRLISPDLAHRKLPSGLIIGKDELISIMINEEDHLRIQSLQPGLEINKAWEAISRIDDELAEMVEFSFSEQYGYLTACPTNVGTGMRVSVFIHLAGLTMSGKLETIIKDKIPGEITMRGFYGEGTEALGNIFQISNQLTLGRTEQGILDRLINVAESFIKMEKEARQRLLNYERIKLEDKIGRSVGVIKHAKVINSIEVINLLSLLRLGIDLNLTQHIEKKELNEIMVLVQPAHLQKYYGKMLDSNERDILRANLLRKKLNL